MSKISKTMKAELIADHFAEQGKRLTNLKRVDVSKLDELILKHNIDIERLQKKRADIAVVEKEAKIQREKEYEEKQRIYMEECKAKEAERLRLWNSITEAQQLIICEKLVVRANEDGQNKYDADIVHTNALERKAITAGSRVVREGPTTLRINGVIVQTGYDFTPQTKEEYFSNMPQSFVHMNKYSYEFVLPDIEQMTAENKELARMSAEDRNVAVVPVPVVETPPVVVKKVVKRKVVKKPVVAEPAVPEEKEMTPEEVYGLAYATIEKLQTEVADLKAQLAKAQQPQSRVVKRVVKSKEAVVKNQPVKKTPERKARPTFHLAKMNTFNYDYTLFKHERGGFCKYAVYNNTANHYVACDFDGDKIIGWGAGTIYKTLNAWTTANWKEQRIKDGNNKTTRNNAYRETKYIPLQMNDLEKMEYGPVYEDIEWESSMFISTTNESEEDSEFMCELIDCATCKRPTMRKDMYWKEGGCCMTDLCEPCHKAKI